MVAIRGGVAELTIDAAEGDLEQQLVTAVHAVFADQQVHRIEVRIAAADGRRRALHRTGFRLDGVLRARLIDDDECVYALLRTDATQGRAAFTAVMNTVTARKRVIAHLLLTDARNRVCVLETTFKPDFELPGGILEVAESPREGLRREALEELDLRVDVGALLVVDWLTPYLGWEDAIELIFDGGTCTAPEALRPDGREIWTAHWLEPEAAIAAMAPFAQGRLRAALQARDLGRTAYLEGGTPVS